jgi:hypothetical protein
LGKLGSADEAAENMPVEEGPDVTEEEEEEEDGPTARGGEANVLLDGCDFEADDDDGFIKSASKEALVGLVLPNTPEAMSALFDDGNPATGKCALLLF